MSNKVSTENKIFFIGILFGIVYLSYQIINPVLNVIVLSVLTVFIFTPIFNKLKKQLNLSSGWASAITTALVLLTVIVPIVILATIAVNQISVFVSDLSSFVTSSNVGNTTGYFNINSMLGQLNLAIASVLPESNIAISLEQVQNFLSSVALPVGQFLTSRAFAFVGNLPSFITELVIYVIITSALFANQFNVRKFLSSITPWDNTLDNIYFKKVRAMSVSMIKGTFVVATIQGLIAGLLLHVAGVQYVFFWTILSIFLGVIPVGSGFINFPIGVILLFTGNIFGGLIVLIGNVFIVNTIDNILRPRLVSSEATLHPALTLIGIIGGLQAFGFFGFIFGPVIMILLITSLELYRDIYKSSSSK